MPGIPLLANVSFLVNQIRDRDAQRGAQLEEEIREAAGAVEPGEHLQCRIYLGSVPGIESDPFFSVRIGQLSWSRRLMIVPPMLIGTLRSRASGAYSA